MQYQIKYNKYKKKYLNLKNKKLYGGFHDINDEIQNDNIYCKTTQEIVPYKKYMIKILDDIGEMVNKDLIKKIKEEKEIDSKDIPEKIKKDMKNAFPSRILSLNENLCDIIDHKDNDYCVNTFPNILGGKYNPFYKSSIEKYIISSDFKNTFENLFFNMTPISFLSNNSFYPILDPNFIIYKKRTIDGIEYYFEIYRYESNTTHEIKNYLLTPIYTLSHIHDFGHTVIVPKILSFPLCHNAPREIYDTSRYIIDGFIIAYDLEKFKNILKMFYLNASLEMSNWIKYFLTFELNPIVLLHHESFKIMDAFIISNNYHIYFEYIYTGILELNIGQQTTNIDVSSQELLELNEKNNLEIKDYFIKIIDDPNYNIYEDIMLKKNPLYKIIEFILLKIEPIKIELINAYNCGKINYLAQITIREPNNKNFYKRLEELNKYLKFTQNQILTMIVSDLYNELYDFLILSLIIIPYDLLCILNSIYYYRIYNLANIKNLINYQSQFSINKLNETYSVKPVSNNYVQTLPRINFTNKIALFYDILLSNIPGYINFKYTELFAKIDLPLSDGSLKNNYPICGEITILNLINLLILDNGKLNADLLPETAIDSLKHFYRKYKTIEELKSKIIISEFTNILWNIPFDIIMKGDVPDTDYSIYTDYSIENSKIKYGVEIEPSYENICRVLIYILGLSNVDGLNIYNIKKSKLISLNINGDTLLTILKQINSLYAKKMVEVYTYEHQSDLVVVDLKKFGIMTLHKNHSEYNITMSVDIISQHLYNYNYSTKIYPFLQNYKIHLHFAYCNLIIFNYIYAFVKLNENFLKFFSIINKNYNLTLHNSYQILTYIIDNDITLYNKIIKENDIYKNLFKFYSNQFNELNAPLSQSILTNICNFINKIVLNRISEYHIFNIDESDTLLLLQNCISHVSDEQKSLYMSFITLPKIFTNSVFDDSYYINVDLRRAYFNIFKICNFSLYDHNEVFVLDFIHNVDNSIKYVENKNEINTLVSKFPHLLLNILLYNKDLIYDDEHTMKLCKSRPYDCKKYITNIQNIIIKLLNILNYDIALIHFNDDIVKKLCSISEAYTLFSSEIINKINDKYIEYYCINGFSEKIINNLVINYNFISYINSLNSDFSDDLYNDIFIQILESPIYIVKINDLSIYLNFIVYLLTTQTKSIDEIQIYLFDIIKSGYYDFFSYIEQINIIEKYIPDLIVSFYSEYPRAFNWAIFLKNVHLTNYDISQDFIELLLINNNIIIRHYKLLPSIIIKHLFNIWNKYLFENHKLLNNRNINSLFLFFNKPDIAKDYINEYVLYINKLFDSNMSFYDKFINNITEIIRILNIKPDINKSLSIVCEYIYESYILLFLTHLESEFCDLPKNIYDRLFPLWHKYLYDNFEPIDVYKINLLFNFSNNSYIDDYVLYIYTIFNNDLKKHSQLRKNIKQITELSQIQPLVKINLTKIINTSLEHNIELLFTLDKINTETTKYNELSEIIRSRLFYVWNKYLLDITDPFNIDKINLLFKLSSNESINRSYIDNYILFIDKSFYDKLRDNIILIKSNSGIHPMVRDILDKIHDSIK